MPHKRNPVKCEQLCGLARVLRSNLQAGFEDVALWHERDISHSSVERIILPDSLLLAHYVVTTFTTVVRGMTVSSARMLENLDASYGLVFSQPVLLALVESGMSRDGAYRIVQRNAMKAWEERRSFHDLLAADAGGRLPCSTTRPSPRASTSTALANIDRVFAALDAPDGLARAPQTRRRGYAGGRSRMSDATLKHIYTGKVRELYEVAHDRLLMVASDRVSVFDVVLPDEIPDKGRVLTGLSSWWFDQTASLVPNHVISADPTDFPEITRDVEGRAMLVRATRPVRLECVVRGYVFGHGWSEYREKGTIGGHAARPV